MHRATLTRCVEILPIVVPVVLIIGAISFLSRPSPPTPLDPARLHPPGEPGVSYCTLDSAGHLASTQHKDARGLSPLEILHTPTGDITIQRTFGDTGTLLKEEAFRAGHPVPLPAHRKAEQ